MRRIPIARASAALPQPAADLVTPDGSRNPIELSPVLPGTLYLVPVPIGNSEDITLRGLRVLREASCIAVESLAVARNWMQHWNIATPLLPYGGRAGKSNCAEVLSHLQAGRDAALICDAGTPGIADPCLFLVCAALQKHLPVVALPGPAAALVALTASGLPATRFVFDGFPPTNSDERHSFFQQLAGEERAIVLYETPSRLRATLNALEQTLGSERRVALAWDLTKPTETWLRGTLEEVRARATSRARRGEVTLVIAGLFTDAPTIPG